MNYDKARKKIRFRLLIGVVIFVITFLSTIVSALKMFYFGLGNGSGDPLSGAIARAIKQFVYFVYNHTESLLWFFWKYSPTPNPRDLFAIDTIASFVMYIGVFLGMAYLGSANSLSTRLAEIRKKHENELIRASMHGGFSSKRQEIQTQVLIPNSGLLSQFHAMYLAPIIATLVAALIGKLSGLGG